MTPIHNIAFNFNDAEDRIVLRCTFPDQVPVALLLTRRMAAPLLEKLVKLLMKTSEVAAALPTKLREEVMLMEHAHALAKIAGQAAQAVAVPDAQEEMVHHLLTRIDFQRQPGRCTLLFFCDGGDTVFAVITLNRAQLHWFVDTLDRFALRFGWELRPPQRDWLALRDEGAAVSSGMAVLH